MNKAAIRGLNMAKPKSQSNKEHIEKLKSSGGKTFQILLTKDEVEQMESFKALHGLSTNKQMLKFLLNYNLVGFNDVEEVSKDDTSVIGDCFIYHGKKYNVLSSPEYGSMCRDVETGKIFPIP